MEVIFMMVNESIPKELSIGEIYSSFQINSFVSENSDTVVICDENLLMENSNKLKVKNKIQGYLAKNEGKNVIHKETITDFYILMKA
jgi:hypothetical protein